MGADPGGIFRQRLLIHGHPNGTLFRRKLDGVSQQVDQHLIQPHTVTAYVFRKNVVGYRFKALVFRLDLGLHDIDNTVDHLLQRHGLNVQRHLAAFNLGYIQNVVDQPQQMLAGKLDFTQIIPHLLRIVRMVQGQGCHTDDGVHGGAYIVAHAGKEVLLC